MLHCYPAQLRTDNAGKYSGKLKKDPKEYGTLWLPTEPDPPDHNGKAKRLNQTIGDRARTILNASSLHSHSGSMPTLVQPTCKTFFPTSGLLPLPLYSSFLAQHLSHPSFILLVPGNLYMYCQRSKVSWNLEQLNASF
ncbi:hypothetical protein O181_004726 [Austropuccinia psidii MF-1]|uniref:Integrase catalytic domain-containing protein n=1 Tax=Austropuccinia psidii MF-1 TaxID=1389203 RepID=A0A9Q3GFA1_9BASI|nr:hypothetical protein [Austropuccinia psidii MF-1]